MNILFVTQIDPRDTNRGSAQRTHLLWEALKKCGSVYTFVPTGRGTKDEIIESERIHKGCLDSPNFVAFLLDRILLRLTGVARWPFRSKRFVEKRLGWTGIKFDFVVTRYLTPVALTSAWKIAPTLVDVDDLPVEVCRGALRKIVARDWSKVLLRRMAGAWIANVSHGTAVRKSCERVWQLNNVALEAGPDYQVNGKQRPLLMTVGLMNFRPNYEGVDWFLKNVWPQFHAKHPEFSYNIAGGGLPAQYCERWAALPGVVVCGYVKDLDSLYESALAVVAPIFTGSGTCIKSIEAALRGRILLATPFAMRGLAREDIEKMRMNEFSAANEFCECMERVIGMPKEEREELQREIQMQVRAINSISQFEKNVRTLIAQCGG